MAEIRSTPTAARSPGTRNETYTAARVLNIVFGVWLFISAFLWTHSYSQYTNTWLMGVLCIIFAASAFAVSWARYLNTALAIWLFISAFALPSISSATVWNNALVAIAIFVASLLPMMAERRPFMRRRQVA